MARHVFFSSHYGKEVWRAAAMGYPVDRVKLLGLRDLQSEDVVLARPHHLIDIICQHGAGMQFRPHPYGHAQHAVAGKVIGDQTTMVQFVVGADDICSPCKHLVEGRCDDVLGQCDPPRSKQEYNDDLDVRLLEHLGIAEGEAMTFRRYLQRIRDRLAGLAEVCSHPGEDAGERLTNLKAGLSELRA